MLLVAKTVKKVVTELMVIAMDVRKGGSVLSALLSAHLVQCVIEASTVDGHVMYDAQVIAKITIVSPRMGHALAVRTVILSKDVMLHVRKIVAMAVISDLEPVMAVKKGFMENFAHLLAQNIVTETAIHLGNVTVV